MDMTIIKGLPNSYEESSVITGQLPPSHSKLCSSSSTTRRSLSFASCSGSENIAFNDSNNTEIYRKSCMVPPNMSGESKKSLSFVGNRQSVEDRLDNKQKSIDSLKANATEDQTWTIINQEIFEWQFICATGRPFWWSPESGYNRFRGTLPSWHNPHILRQEIDVSSRLDCDLEKRDLPEHIDDLHSKDTVAHIIALQLLSACFTLPPTSIQSPTPDYTLVPNVLDSRMISSLRMHTHYRYSPSFGHNARNTSPIEGWSSCDSFTRSPSPNNMDEQIATLKSFKAGSRRNRRHRRHNSNLALLHQRSSWHELDSAEFTSSQVLDEEPYRKAALALFDVSSRQSKSPVPKKPSIKHVDHENGLDQKPLAKTNYSLQPVIRSEPHPVYIQPVRELVVKNWTSPRRNFGGSLHAPLPSRRSREMESRTSESASISSPIIDGRLRRRRAQERGDIDSSADDGPPNNSLTSSYQGSEAVASSLDLRAVNRSGRTTERTDRESDSAEPATTLPEKTPSRLGGSASRFFASSRLKLCRARRKSCLSEMLTSSDFPSPEPLKTASRVDDRVFEARKRALSHSDASLELHDVPKFEGEVDSFSAGLRMSRLTLTRGREARLSGSSVIIADEDPTRITADIVQDAGKGHT